MTKPAHDVIGDIAYIDVNGLEAEHLVYPLSSGKKIVRPQTNYRPMSIKDARHLTKNPSIDHEGFAIVNHESSVTDFYDSSQITGLYYSEISSLLKSQLHAKDVIIFDYNQRSKVRAKAGQSEVRTPVEAAHVDYTMTSGPKRSREILENAQKNHYQKNRLALVNVWRPIIGPAQDFPLAICSSTSVADQDLIKTDIHHFSESNLKTPRHSGQIYSLKHNQQHEWYYYPDMQTHEALLLRNWDSGKPTTHGYTPHTGFRNSLAPVNTTPRESIEVRTLVVF
jgi:hypothetical protein